MILIGNCKDELKKLKIIQFKHALHLRHIGDCAIMEILNRLGWNNRRKITFNSYLKCFVKSGGVLEMTAHCGLILETHIQAVVKDRAGNLGTNHNERHMENKHSAIVPNGLKPKDLVGIPWLVAFALQSDGWYLRQDIIWSKPNPMPESVTDRCTKSHEYVFLLSKSRQYYFDNEAIKEPSVSYATDKRADEGRFVYDSKFDGTLGTANQAFVTINETRNKRDVWNISAKPFKGAHFAVMPEALVEPCVLAGSKIGDVVLDPFMGAGTVGLVSQRYQREFIGIELNPEYAAIAKRRMNDCGDVILL